MDGAITVLNNLARTERSIAGRKLDNFEGRQILSDTSTTSSTDTTSSSTTNLTSPTLTTSDLSSTTTITTTSTTSTTSSVTQFESQPTTNTIISSIFVSTTLPNPTPTTPSTTTTATDPSTLTAASRPLSSRAITTTTTSIAVFPTLSNSTLANNPTSTATSVPLSSPTALINSSTPTSAPSQRLNYRVPLIVIGCIAMSCILTLIIIFIIRQLCKKRYVQTGEVRSSIFGVHIPQPKPMIGGTLHEQESLSSEKSLLTPVTMMQYTQRDRPPPSVWLPQRLQQTCLLRAREIKNLVASHRRVIGQLPQLGSRSAPVETTLPEQMQQSSRVGYTQRQLTHPGGLSDSEEPPAYVL